MKQIAAFLVVFPLPVQIAVASDVIGFYASFDELFSTTTASIDDFYREDVRAFTVYVENTLKQDSPDEVETLLTLIAAHLAILENNISAEILMRLRTVNIWLTDNACGHTAAYYHRKTADAWLERNGRPPEMAGSTEFCRVDHLVEGDNLSGYLIHELAHGYHEHYLRDGFDNSIVLNAYDRQWPLRLYHNVLQADGDVDDEGHANSNAIEYFAHLSNKYLGTDGEYPFVSAELRRHDNYGWQLADAVWTNGRLTSEWLSCDQIGTVKSGYQSNRITLTFQNNTTERRYLIWIDQRGEVRWDRNEWYADPGEPKVFYSRRTHLWAVFDENKDCVGVFRPGMESETVEIDQ